MLILGPSNSGLKKLINIQKCPSSTKLDHCALYRRINLSLVMKLIPTSNQKLHKIDFISNLNKIGNKSDSILDLLDMISAFIFVIKIYTYVHAMRFPIFSVNLYSRI